MQARIFRTLGLLEANGNRVGVLTLLQALRLFAEWGTEKLAEAIFQRIPPPVPLDAWAFRILAHAVKHDADTVERLWQEAPREVHTHRRAWQARLRAHYPGERARRLMEELPFAPCVVLYCAMLHCCGTQEEADALVQRMKADGIRLQPRHFGALMRVAAERGDVYRCEELLRKLGSELRVEHYNIMLRAHVRGGGSSAALDDVVRQMEAKGLRPNGFTWAILIGACKAERPPQVRRAEALLHNAVSAGVRGPGPWTQLLEVYAVALEQPGAAADAAELLRRAESVYDSIGATCSMAPPPPCRRELARCREAAAARGVESTRHRDEGAVPDYSMGCNRSYASPPLASYLGQPEPGKWQWDKIEGE